MFARVLIASAHVISKVVAVALLGIMLLGYLYFFGSHSELTHLYMLATAAALIFTIGSGPSLATSKVFMAGFWLVAIVASPLGVWRIHGHLAFLDGPEYGPAAMEAAAIVTYWFGLLASRLWRPDPSARADA